MNKTLYWGNYGFMSVQAHERGEHASADVYVFACGALLWKDSPCCLGLVCARAILSCSRDCNKQLAAHQALSLGPGFPGRSPGPVCVCMHVCAAGAAWCWGTLKQGLGRGLVGSALCPMQRERVSSRLVASKLSSPQLLTPVSMVPRLALARQLKALELVSRAWGLMEKSSWVWMDLSIPEPGSSRVSGEHLLSQHIRGIKEACLPRLGT